MPSRVSSIRDRINRLPINTKVDEIHTYLMREKQQLLQENEQLKRQLALKQETLSPQIFSSNPNASLLG